MRHGLFCRQYRNSVWRFEPSPLGGAEKIHYFGTCNPAAQKKSIILGRTTLQRRKNPLFWDMQPCGAEKIHYFCTCNPAAQKKSIILGLATLQRRKNPLFLYMQLCGAEKIHYFCTCNPAAQKKSIIFVHATLRRRKNPLFLYMQPRGAENPEALLPQTLGYAKRRSISVTETLPPKTNQKK